MVNERLRRTMLHAGIDPEGLAARAEVCVKTVERWLHGTSVPYPKTRYRVAAILQEDEAYLWPDAIDKAGLIGAELVAGYPRRNDVPRHLWTEILRGAKRNVDLIASAGLFLAEEHPDWIPTLAAKAEAGVRVRLLFGDPDGRQLAARDAEHQIGGGVAGRVAAVLAYYGQRMPRTVQIRLHDTPLYKLHLPL